MGTEVSVMSKKNYDYFLSNLDDLVKKYREKYVVIKDESIIGCYDSFSDAYDATIQREKLGTFIIQYCIEKDRLETANFLSNNIKFAQV